MPTHPVKKVPTDRQLLKDDGIQKAIRFPLWLHDKIQADADSRELSFSAWIRIVAKRQLVKDTLILKTTR